MDIQNKTRVNSEAIFKIKSAFQLRRRQFFILGDILSGTIKIGIIADFSSIGIEKKILIEAIEFALHREGGNAWEDIGLGFSDLSEPEKKY